MKLLCLLLAAGSLCSTMNAETIETGVTGVISISPTHGGPIHRDEPDSKPLPNVAFVIKKGDAIVALFTTDEHGAFRVTLRPGDYTISRKDSPGGIGKFEDHPFEVTEGEMKQVNWTIDSGIR